MTSSAVGRETLAELIAREVAERDRASGCWIWTHCRNIKGYGRVGYESRTWLVSHVALTFDGRPRPDARSLARHACDMPACYNPSCLSWGTAQENSDDMTRRGRQARGNMKGKSRLSEHDVRWIRRQASAGARLAEIGKPFGMDASSIWKIVNRQRWAHLS